MECKWLFIWRWAGPVWRASSPRWDDFYPKFMWNLLSQFNQKFYVAGSISVQSKILCCWKKTVSSSSFYNTQWRKAIMQNKCSYIFLIKQSWLKKTLCRLSGLALLRMFIWKIFISPRWDLGKIKWDLTSAGWLASHLNIFIFL